MIIGDKKKAATLILERMGAASGKPMQAQAKPEEAIGEDDQSKLSIAQEILVAFKNDSARDLMMGLEAFFNEMQEPAESEDSAEGHDV